MTIKERAKRYHQRIIAKNPQAEAWGFDAAYEQGATEQREIDEEELKPQWISVKDRLPNHCETVAVISFHMIFIGFYDELTNTWIVDGEENDHVTRWIPLPMQI